MRERERGRADERAEESAAEHRQLTESPHESFFSPPTTSLFPVPSDDRTSIRSYLIQSEGEHRHQDLFECEN